MKIVKLSDTVGVSEQIQPADVAAIAGAGYRVLINNRPRWRGPGATRQRRHRGRRRSRPVWSTHYLPVTAMDFPGPHADQMADLLDDEDRPVLAFCRSGTRCANLWVTTRPADSREAAARSWPGLSVTIWEWPPGPTPRSEGGR